MIISVIRYYYSIKSIIYKLDRIIVLQVSTSNEFNIPIKMWFEGKHVILLLTIVKASVRPSRIDMKNYELRMHVNFLACLVFQ